VIYSYKNDRVTQLASSPNQLLKLGISNSLGIIAASNKGIFIPSLPSNEQYIFPNGPGENLFPSMSVDGKGNLWSASGKNGIGVGFYKYNGSTWTTYNTTNTPH
jgi:hypothetical protein